MIQTDKYRWEVLDKGGWELDESQKREFEINSLLYSNKDRLIESINPFCSIRLVYLKSDSLLNMSELCYSDNYLKLEGIKIRMKFSDTDDFIDNLLEDNGWKIDERSGIMRKKINFNIGL